MDLPGGKHGGVLSGSDAGHGRKVTMMRETVKDWRNDWIKSNGKTVGLEVIIRRLEKNVNWRGVYEGNFADIPEEYLDQKVIEHYQILASTDTGRERVYVLGI